MDRALELARQVRGTTSPNPPVGAVLVRDGRIVGEGTTQPPGGPHAERVALAAAGDRAAGSTLFVTLEPCSHWGRTPPCTDAIINAGVREVYVAAGDPNPLVNGTGLRRLREAGVAVVEESRAEARELIEGHALLSTRGRPFVTMALAPSAEVLAELLPAADVVFGHDDREHRTRRPLPHVSWGETLRGLAADGVASVLVLLGDDDSAAVQHLLDEGLPDKAIAASANALPGLLRDMAEPWHGLHGAVVVYHSDGL
jgi:pyrimidine deaminase RibD-like protein